MLNKHLCCGYTCRFISLVDYPCEKYLTRWLTRIVSVVYFSDIAIGGGRLACYFDTRHQLKSLGWVRVQIQLQCWWWIWPCLLPVCTFSPRLMKQIKPITCIIWVWRLGNVYNKFQMVLFGWPQMGVLHNYILCNLQIGLTLTVLVTTIDALQHFETG